MNFINQSKTINESWKEYILSHMEESKASAFKTTLAIQDSPLKYDIPRVTGTVSAYTRTLQIPKIFDQQDKALFESICQTMTSVFEKTIEAYKKDPQVRQLFGFEPLLETLILKTPPYSRAIPICRVDIFYDENARTFKFCEFNTDGTSAMFENDTVHSFLPLNNAWNHFQPQTEYMDLMDPWMDAFLSVWESAGKKEPLSIVITDILENAYTPEIYGFETAFKKRGIACEVEDIRNLALDGKGLYSKRTKTRYNAVYRRAVAKDVMDHAREVQPFIQAVLEDRVTVIGDFQTQVVHSKKINEALLDPALAQYFTEEERQYLKEHLPSTRELTPELAEELKEDKNRWILKPMDGYGSKGVWAGVDVSQKQWETLLEDYCQGGYIVQEYLHHFQTPNIDLINFNEFKNYSNLTGLYIFDGQFAGVYSRLSDSGIVSSQYNEKMVPTLFLKQGSRDSV